MSLWRSTSVVRAGDQRLVIRDSVERLLIGDDESAMVDRRLSMTEREQR
jgi:hypothetical protein